MGSEVYEAMVKKSRELQIQNTEEFKEVIKTKNARIAAINEVRKAQGKKPIDLVKIPDKGIFKAGFKAFKTSFADSWSIAEVLDGTKIWFKLPLSQSSIG